MLILILKIYVKIVNQNLKFFGVETLSLLTLASFLSYSLDSVYPPMYYDKNNENGIKENRGYIKNVTEYDKNKSCSNGLSKIPNAIEYLTYFNCGHVNIDWEKQQTTREFTLIAEEDKTIPISNQGHQFKAWTYMELFPSQP